MEENIVWYVKYAEIINIIGLVSSFVTIGTAIYAGFLKKDLNKTKVELSLTQINLNETKTELLRVQNTIKDSGNFNNNAVNNGTQFSGGCGIHGNHFNIKNGN